MRITRIVGATLVLVALGCDGRPVQEAPEGASSPAADAAPSPWASGCDAPAQLVVAAASLDGAVTTVREVVGHVGMASSGAPPGGAKGFANHHVDVLFRVEGGPDVSVFLSLDRVLAIGEVVAIDPVAPGLGSLSIYRANDWTDSVSTVDGDRFSGWTRVTRRSEHELSATFCLLAWRGSSKASFSWARVSLPETAFADR